MSDVTLDCRNMISKEQAHPYLAQMLGFPDYYGNNLDALFDCLTELGECAIRLEHADSLGQADCYGAKILKTFQEAAEANPRISLELL